MKINFYIYFKMVLTPREVFENSRDHSVLIIDNFRKEAAYWNGHELSDKRELDLRRVFSVLKLQSHKVCRGLIGMQYVHGKFDDISESSLLILVFENNSRVFELRSKKIPWQRLRGFTSCKVTGKTVTIDLVCATFPRLGTELINYVLRYADKYEKLNVHLDAATIQLACNFYREKFGFKFSKKEVDAGHDKRCLEEGRVDESELDEQQMFKMFASMEENRKRHTESLRAVASRTRAKNSNIVPGTRKSNRISERKGSVMGRKSGGSRRISRGSRKSDGSRRISRGSRN